MKLHKNYFEIEFRADARAIEGKRTRVTPTNSWAVNRDVRQKPIFLDFDRLARHQSDYDN